MKSIILGSLNSFLRSEQSFNGKVSLGHMDVWGIADIKPLISLRAKEALRGSWGS